MNGSWLDRAQSRRYEKPLFSEVAKGNRPNVRRKLRGGGPRVIVICRMPLWPLGGPFYIVLLTKGQMAHHSVLGLVRAPQAKNAANY